MLQKYILCLKSSVLLIAFTVTFQKYYQMTAQKGYRDFNSVTFYYPTVYSPIFVPQVYLEMEFTL